MNILNNNIKSEIKEHSLLEYPNECCGIIIKKNNELAVVRCENSAGNKKEFFEIGPHEYLKASNLGEIKGYYHSHTRHNYLLSGSDKAVSIGHRLPLVMYSTVKDNFIEYQPI